MSGLRTCGVQLLLHQCFEVYAATNALQFATLNIARQGGCDFTACEINYEWAESIHHLEQDRRMRLVVNLRSPARLVTSMYAMCQNSTLSPLGKALLGLKPSSMEAWLESRKDTDILRVPGTAIAGKECYFNPFNMMTSRLSTFDLESKTASLNLTLAKQRLSGAFHVGVSEEYQASLCLLLKKLGKFPRECQCESHKDLSVTRVTWATRTADVVLSTRARELIEEMTALDTQLYDHARHLFIVDLREHGLECLLGRK
mmetsp:Transcript_4000/g.10350  ORF Transcript_4000/g.10350 Transcript_4000/m.10350 type:complete len:258 (-) Transcript_4000:65-838(-)